MRGWQHTARMPSTACASSFAVFRNGRAGKFRPPEVTHLYRNTVVGCRADTPGMHDFCTAGGHFQRLGITQLCSNRACGSTRGSALNKPGTSVQISICRAARRPASRAAEVSDPPLPSSAVPPEGCAARKPWVISSRGFVCQLSASSGSASLLQRADSQDRRPLTSVSGSASSASLTSTHSTDHAACQVSFPDPGAQPLAKGQQGCYCRVLANVVWRIDDLRKQLPDFPEGPVDQVIRIDLAVPAPTAGDVAG